MMARLRSAVFLLFMVITVIPYAFLCTLAAPLPLHLRYKITMGWPRMAVWGARVFCGVRYEVRGWENLPTGPAVVLSKHQSAWETLFYPSHLPRELCFVYKAELHWVPFFGWGLKLLDMISINRQDKRSAMQQVLAKSSERLRENRWPILFPEGTRVPVGQVGRYQTGGARIAVNAGVPVVPIAHNAGECWPRNAFVKKPGLITVSIGPPIAAEGLSAAALNQRAQDWIEGEMRRISPHRYRDTAD